MFRIENVFGWFDHAVSGQYMLEDLYIIKRSLWDTESRVQTDRPAVLAFSLIRLLGLELSLLALEEPAEVNRREDIGLFLVTSDVSISEDGGASILPVISQSVPWNWLCNFM